MDEKDCRVRVELTAVFNGRLELGLVYSERRPNGGEDPLASDPHDHPCDKSGNNACNGSDHKFLLFIVSPA
jgi:hypothetical protein